MVKLFLGCKCKNWNIRYVYGTGWRADDRRKNGEALVNSRALSLPPIK